VAFGCIPHPQLLFILELVVKVLRVPLTWLIVNGSLSNERFDDPSQLAEGFLAQVGSRASKWLIIGSDVLERQVFIRSLYLSVHLHIHAICKHWRMQGVRKVEVALLSYQVHNCYEFAFDPEPRVWVEGRRSLFNSVKLCPLWLHLGSMLSKNEVKEESRPEVG